MVSKVKNRDNPQPRFFISIYITYKGDDTMIYLRPIRIKGMETTYKVSSDGDVYSIKDNGKLKKLKPGDDKDGYYKVGIYINHKVYTRRINRLVAEIFIPIPDRYIELGLTAKDLEVNHIDGDKHNNDVSNLEWATTKENIHHAWKHKLAKAHKGDNHPNSVYTSEDVKKVCKHLVANKLTMKEISEKTGVSYTVVKQIKNKVIWKDVSKHYNFSHYNVSKKTTRSDKEIRKVCKLLSKGVSVKDVSKETGIPKHVIQTIYDRKRWTRVSKKYKW